MNFETPIKLTNFLTKAILLFLGLALPLFFLPQTADIIEFPKQILLWITVLLLLLLTILKFLLEGEVKFLKTPLSYPIFLFLLIYIVSAFLAPDRYQSLLGFFGRPNSGFLAVFAYFAIFYFVSFYIEELKEGFWAVWAFLAGIFALSILAIFNYFGFLFLPFDFARINSFSPAGGLFPLSQILAFSAPIILGLISYFQFSYQDDKTQRALKLSSLYLLLPILILALVLANTLPGWVGLGAGFVVFLTFLPQDYAKKILPYILAVLAFLILALIVTQTSFFRTKFPILDVTLAKPQGLSIPVSWNVAVGVVRDYPFFGTGPASFLSDFTRYRPIQINLTDAWNLRFVQSGSLYLDILATTGVLGFITFLLIIARFAQYSLQAINLTKAAPIFPVKLALAAAIIGLLASFIFYSFSTTGLFVLGYFLGLIFAIEKISGSTLVSKMKLQTPPSAVFLLIILAIGTLAGFWATGRTIMANINYTQTQKFLTKNDLEAAQRTLGQAISNNPFEDVFWLDLSRVNLALTDQILAKKDLSNQDRQRALATLDAAIRNARQAVNLAPSKVINWETLGDTYAAYATQIQGATDAAINAYTKAILQDPPNPNLWLKAGNLLSLTGNLNSVIDSFKQAVRLKPNLIDARIYLARSLELKGEYKESEEQYKIAQQLAETLQDKKIKEQILEQVNSRLEFVKTKIATPSASPQPPTP